MLNRKLQPEIVNAVDFDLTLKTCERFTLDNGVPVYSLNAGEQEVLMVEWVFYAGNWYEEKNIVAAITNFLLKNGTTNRSAFEINEHFDSWGAHLNRACYNETATVTLHSLSKHLDKLLPVVASLFNESTMPQGELDIYRQIQKQKLSVSLKKSEFVAGRVIDELLYGFEHPYGIYSSFEDYDALTQQELLDFYKKFYTHGNCVIFVAGMLPANIQSLLNQHFGSLPFNTQPLPQTDHVIKPATGRKKHIANDPNGVQSAIRIARPFPNRHHPDFIRVQVLNNIFGGYFGSRLMSNIREDKGYTYGIHSYLQNHIQQSAWVVSTEAGRDVCAATIEEVYKEMKRLREEPVGDEELQLVRNYMIGSILGDLDGPFQVISRWKNYVLNQLTDAYFYESINTIKTISAEEIRELAVKYLDPEAFYELTVI
ncbi:MAG TPA: pitrilysin family protein [Panacibacter sp.]|nr:pitrilysin family protein [Panacibacter sp.]HNP44123.1 pitrilysin family protein [Panacibacter sp.]